MSMRTHDGELIRYLIKLPRNVPRYTLCGKKPVFMQHFFDPRLISRAHLALGLLSEHKY